MMEKVVMNRKFTFTFLVQKILFIDFITDHETSVTTVIKQSPKFGSNIWLHCHPKDAQSQLRWFFNFAPITVSRRFKLYGNGTLGVKNLQKSMYGEYSCYNYDNFGRTLAIRKFIIEGLWNSDIFFFFWYLISMCRTCHENQSQNPRKFEWCFTKWCPNVW